MTDLRFAKHEKIDLKSSSAFDEKWVQARIAEDPAILGLGDLILKDKERNQPRAGRLDLLLQDSETDRRYEVEVQLGATDESHIIRTIEYWDIERKRFPAYDHCAVLVAENVTSRFQNVISLLNGAIPFIAIQMNAIKIDKNIALVFTKVIDELKRGLEEDDESALTDRNYWETARGSKETVSLVDELLKMVRVFAPQFELKYNKFYIGLAKDGMADNFVIFRAKKQHLNFEPRLEPSEEIKKLLDDSDLDVMDYDKRWGRYRIRLTRESLKRNRDLLDALMRRAFEASGRT